MKRSVIVMIGLAAVLVMVGVAQATTVYTNISGWAAFPSQTVDGRIFTFQSSTLPGDTGVTFTVFPGSSSSVTVGAMMLGAGTYSLNLQYTVDQNVSPYVFSAVKVDTDLSLGSVTLTKIISEPNPDVIVSSVDGAPMTAALPNLKFLTVLDTFSNTGAPNTGVNLLSSTNTFHESVIPEPVTMVSLFLAIGGLGTYIRRRTKVVQ